VFRESNPQDIAPIQELLAEAGLSFQASFTSSGALCGASPDCYYVAESDRKIIGVLYCRCVADEAEIFDLAVQEKFRRRGIATLLVNRFQQSAERRGIKNIFLEVRESNTAALALYRKTGFRETGKRSNYYHAPIEDALLLRLEISHHY
jgi:ribosomal-protein-alanine N-acetyltransferase